MFKFASEPQTIGNAISDSFRLAKSVIGKVLPLTLIIGILQVIQLYLEPPMRHLGKKALETTPQAAPSAGTIIALVLIALVVLYLIIALLHRIYNTTQDPNSSLGNSLSFAARKFFPVFVAIIVVVIIEALAMVVFAGISIGAGYIFSSISLQFAKAVTTLFYAGSVIAMLYVIMMLYFFFPAMVADNLGIFASIKQSWKIAWGNWWHIFLIFVVPFLVVVVAWIIAGIISYMIGPENKIVFAITQLLVAIVFFPWMNSTYLVIYNNLKLKKAAKDAAS